VGSECLGPCNSRWRKAEALYREALREHDETLASLRSGDDVPDPPAPPEIRPWPGDPVWCPRCQGQIHAQLAELDDLAAMLATVAPLARASEDSKAGKITGSPEEHTASPRMDDLEELGEWLRSWESAARETDPGYRRDYLATEVTRLISWLVFHFDTLITHPDKAADFGAEVRRWHREMSRKAAAGEVRRHKKQPCPRCGLYTLWWSIGEEYVKCINEDCCRVLTLAEYDGLAEAAALT
jgi:hypothetical protein